MNMVNKNIGLFFGKQPVRGRKGEDRVLLK
jgi:hypothetical protein